ncbi:MAG: 16S rRNA (guanine(527)-N(7))-methyltransferase RsmG [Brachymonas sp.]
MQNLNTELSQLDTAAKQLGLDLNVNQASQLLAYRDRIAQWNKVYNLTSLRDTAQMLSHHIIDSLAAAPPLLRFLKNAGLEKASMLDVGSGGGLPGVVLAIMLPHIQVTCVDTVGKKAAFVQQVAGELSLKNLRGVHSRVEQMQTAPFDVITSRAFASLLHFVQLTRPQLKPQGAWMALKGKQPEQEIAAVPADVSVFHVEQLAVPGLDAERCIVWMRPR